VPRRQPDAPPLPLYLTEVPRAAGDFALYRAALPLAPLLPRGDGHPVLVLPGLLADDRSTRIMRTTLRRLGYRVHGWRLGRNIGPTAACIADMHALVVDLHQRYGQPITIIGWSLGGIFARQLARDEARRVRQVITLGSPFKLASSDQSRAHKVYQRYAHLHVQDVQLPLEHQAIPLTVPATSLYSKLDGIVAWTACLESPGSRAENIAVLASHLGIGHHPAALYAIADRLAQEDGTWAPFRPPALLRAAFPRPDAPNTNAQR
jgi:pimeloyl-ACP methyl ester carboxylesterase